MSKHHPVLLAFASVTLSVVFCLIILEVILHFLPVNSYIPLQPVTAEDPVVRGPPNIRQTYSAGWYFDARHSSKTNAQGYVSGIDFENNPERPLVAVVGDSYIEARMIPFEQTLQQRLNVALGDGTDVYGVGVGGAPMSQYPIFAQMMWEKYDPDFLIVSIVENDFDESLPEYKNMPRFHYFVEDEKGQLRPTLIGEHRPGFFKELMSKSSLVRYLYFNLNLSYIVNRVQFAARSPDNAAPSEEAAAKDETRVTKSKQAVDAFLKLLPDYAGLPKNKILITVDAGRAYIYAGEKLPEDDYFYQVRNHLLSNARRQGYHTLDLQEVFEKEYAAHGKSFEYTEDRHWNPYAHGVVADAILDTGLLNRYKNR